MDGVASDGGYDGGARGGACGDSGVHGCPRCNVPGNGAQVREAEGGTHGGATLILVV